MIEITVTVKRPAMLEPGVFQAALVRGATRAAATVERRAKLNVSGRMLKIRTGRLWRSIKTKVKPKVAGVTATVTANPLKNIYHSPQRAILIRPKAKQALRFTIGGRTVFAAHVQRPAQPARPFLSTAGHESNADIVAAVRASIQLEVDRPGLEQKIASQGAGR